MKSFAFAVFLVVLLACAESVSACNAKVNFDACINRGNQMASLCSQSDLACQCQRQKDILTCYNLCGDDYIIMEQRKAQDSTVSQLCVSASSAMPNATVAQTVAQTVQITGTSSIASASATPSVRSSAALIQAAPVLELMAVGLAGLLLS
ncbi:uncharacterized protein VTP21DRAFT_6121 [Calcarisporiella thermophila]|uniref:uncharacterized protein n=1 Tax=Calcarisporiella thermophila TaxID=911321 RepID=UPI003742BC72